VCYISGGVSRSWPIAIGKAVPGSRIPALYAAAVVNGLWRSDNGGVSSYTQLDNAKTRFSLRSGIVLGADSRIFK
jgi:hypothetical protein